MKKININEIMAEISIDTEDASSATGQEKSRKPGKSVSGIPPFSDVQLSKMSIEDLMGLLHSYQGQFLEMLNYGVSEPIFADFGSLQEDLNNNYRILEGDHRITGFISRVISKLFGFKEILAKQEQFNAIATRIINRDIEINTSIVRELFHMRTQLFFLSIQAKLSTRILEEIKQTVDIIARDKEHQVRRDEHIASVLPKLFEMYKEFEQFRNDQEPETS